MRRAWIEGERPRKELHRHLTETQSIRQPPQVGEDIAGAGLDGVSGLVGLQRRRPIALPFTGQGDQAPGYTAARVDLERRAGVAGGVIVMAGRQRLQG